VQFFSGFSLTKEEFLFESFIDKSDFNVCGFSYGSIKALNYTLKKLREGERVDRLQLFSPAFFQTKDKKFKRLQLMAYKKNESAYIGQFLEACFAPYEMQRVEQCMTKSEELKELLEYEWSLSQLVELKSNGVAIEVYLGAKDEIVDAKSAEEFFKEVATVTFLKSANHFLQIS